MTSKLYGKVNHRLNMAQARQLSSHSTQSGRVELSRAWDAIFDAVKAANSTEGFTGEGGTLVLSFSGKNIRSASAVPSDLRALVSGACGFVAGD